MKQEKDVNLKQVASGGGEIFSMKCELLSFFTAGVKNSCPTPWNLMSLRSASSIYEEWLIEVSLVCCMLSVYNTSEQNSY